MDELREALKAVPHSYADFVNGICSELRDNEDGRQKLLKFMRQNPDASTGKVITFFSDEIMDEDEDE